MKREDVFERLDPPAGGIARLRERMAARPSLARRLVPIAAPLAIAAAALLFFFWSRARVPDLVAAARRQAGPEQVALGLVLASGERPVTLTDHQRSTAALEQVPTATANVTFYWVSSTQ